MNDVQFNHDLLRKQDTQEVKSLNSHLSDLERSLKNSSDSQEIKADVASIMDAKAQLHGQNFVNKVADSFSKELKMKPGKGVQFNLLNDEQSKQYTVGLSTVSTTLGTDIIPTVEHFIRNYDPIVSLCQIIDRQPNQNHQLWDFDTETNAENLTEVQAGTSADEVIRKGDLLIPTTKIQASTLLTELSMSSMDASEYGVFLARLTRRVGFLLASNILSNGQNVANGTARSAGTIRGIVNNYGVNGTGDTNNYIGAITYTSKALADAAITAKGIGASTDSYDLSVKVKRGLLPSRASNVERDSYVFLMNSNTWAAISTVTDLNGRYKGQSSTDPTTGKAVQSIDGTEVILVQSSVLIPDSYVYLIPRNQYVLATQGSILNLNDGGLVSLKEGITTFVSRTWADGSMRYGQKYLSGTAATIGTTAVDNAEQNAYRYFKIN